MANQSNIFDFPNETLDQFLARVVANSTPGDTGTYEEVVGVLKTDAPGNETPAAGISVAAGQLLSNLRDDYLKATYGFMRTASLGGSRLIETPNPTIGGGGGTYTYTFVGDERIAYTDIAPPGTLTLELPSIATLTPGQEFSLRLPSGATTTAIEFEPDGADSLIDPATGLPVGAPGAKLQLAPGTQPAGTILTWKMVAAPDLLWAFQYAAPVAAGGGQPVVLTEVDMDGGLYETVGTNYVMTAVSGALNRYQFFWTGNTKFARLPEIAGLANGTIVETWNNVTNNFTLNVNTNATVPDTYQFQSSAKSSSQFGFAASSARILWMVSADNAGGKTWRIQF
jgi:hypothetical protein